MPFGGLCKRYQYERKIFMDNVKIHYDYKHYYPQLDIPHKEPVVQIEQTKRSKTTMRAFVATRKKPR